MPRLRLPLSYRFWNLVDKGEPDACWEWTGKKDSYGRFKIVGNVLGTASRIAYILTYGMFDPALEVCHRCDNPPCCNPAHLFLGTHSENMRDASAKGRLNRRRVPKKLAA
jgi:hypothetical protein